MLIFFKELTLLNCLQQKQKYSFCKGYARTKVLQLFLLLGNFKIKIYSVDDKL